MAKNWNSHRIDHAESFALRRPVLEAMSSLAGRWRVSPDGKEIEIDLSLSDYSPKERAVIEFAINPYTTAPNIFHALDDAPRRELAKAIAALFGPGGAVDRAGIRAV